MSSKQVESENTHGAEETLAAILAEVVERRRRGETPNAIEASVLDFLLRYQTTPKPGEPESGGVTREMTRRSLEAIVRGGIHDHLGGGFFSSTADRHWLFPRWEKRLCDQALLCRTLADAFRLLGEEEYLDAARETADYVLNRLTGPEGEFRSGEVARAEDAEVGAWAWSRQEVIAILGGERGARFADIYGAEEVQDAKQAGSRLRALRMILPDRLAEFAARVGKSLNEVKQEIVFDKAKLLAERERRAPALRDDRAILAWNALMISALSRLYQASGEAKYLQAARKAARFIEEHMTCGGGLFRIFRNGEAAVEAFLDDNAYFVAALLDLYQSDFDRRWLEKAVRLGEEMLARFWDEEDGAFFTSSRTSESQEQLFARTKDFSERGLPSGNGVAFLDIVELAQFTENPLFEKAATKIRTALACLISPQDVNERWAYPSLLCTAHYLLAGVREIVLSGKRGDPVLEAMVSEVHRRFLPAKILLLAGSAAEAASLSRLVPFIEGKDPLDGKATAYISKKGACERPARDLETLKTQLNELSSTGPR